MSVPVPSTPTNPAELCEQIAQALALAHDYREGTSDAVDCGPSVADYADARAALSVVAPVLEGLRAELAETALRGASAIIAERDALRAERAAALDAAEARGRAEALSKAADAWQRGAWANTPRHRDQVADRVGQAQYVTEWLRERAATTAQSEGDHHA